MADLRSFNNMEEIGTPRPVSRQVASDTSAATRISGNTALVEGLGGVVDAVIRGGDALAEKKAIRGLKGTPGDTAGFENPTGKLDEKQMMLGKDGVNSITTLEAKDLNFEKIFNARRTGAINGDRARELASTKLRSAVAANPNRAEAFRTAYGQYFGSGGAGMGTFDKTEQEALQDNRIKYGFNNFGLDPSLARNNPLEWEERFSRNLSLKEQNTYQDAVISSIESGIELDAIEQRNNIGPAIVNAITNKESPNFIGAQVKAVLASSGMGEDGTFDAAASAKAMQDLDSLKTVTRSQYRNAYSAMSETEFNSFYKPLEDYIDNASMVASGEMTFTQLQRENNIFQEGALAAIYGADQDAAQRFAGLNAITNDMQDVPPSIRVEQTKLAQQLLNSMNATTNPTNPVTGIDVATDPKAYNRKMQSWLNGAPDALTSGHAADVNRGNDALVMVTKDINSNPTAVTSETYNRWFDVIGNEEAFGNLPQETKDMVFDSISNGALDDYLAQTVQEWKRNTPRNVQITYDTTSNRILAVPTTGDRIDRMAANSLNAKLGSTNTVFTAMDGLGVLESSNKVLFPVYEALGISVADGIPDPLSNVTSYNDFPLASRPRRRFSFLADAVAEGSATPSQRNEFQAALDEDPRLMRTGIESLNKAIGALDAPPVVETSAPPAPNADANPRMQDAPDQVPVTLPSGATLNLDGNDPMDAVYKAMSSAETAAAPDPFIRTTISTAPGSSAYGPTQITKKLVDDYLTRKSDLFTPAQTAFLEKMSKQGEVMLDMGNGDWKNLPDDWSKEIDGETYTAADYKTFEYGGPGVLRSPEDKALYEQVAKIMLAEHIRENDGDIAAAIQQWRGRENGMAPEEDYSERFFSTLEVESGG